MDISFLSLFLFIITTLLYISSVPVIGKPDLYELVNADGKELGRAAIQTLSISQALQLKRSTGEPLRVMAEWNDDFESYVVTSVL